MLLDAHALLTFLMAAPATLCLAAATPAEARGAQGHPPHHPSKPINQRTAQEVVAQLNLIPNIEKGYFIETFRDTDNVTTTTGGVPARAASTAIYYLLEGTVGDSVWHRVDAPEVWHYYAGAPLVLSLSYDDSAPLRKVTLGPDVFDGQSPQVVVGKWEWQSARSLGSWTLVGTTVAPGFEVAGSELAEAGWVPNATQMAVVF
ncbi:RmlC-like cupin domain-containing protein [Lasiosphaeris hirsuta]|uniref:RmlC-like cupin domain-containing protein n=1 Tax=Lasiosphaeris hirsuta TaxID=260670 RepID=A0AA40AF79_9PEZI|nr:RmlC-like cupin domain-containing protein [Lasiosphaeris hirsuta]